MMCLFVLLYLLFRRNKKLYNKAAHLVSSRMWVFMCAWNYWITEYYTLLYDSRNFYCYIYIIIIIMWLSYAFMIAIKIIDNY